MKRYLLDTHIVIWALTQPRRLSAPTLALLQTEATFVSAVSLWEVLIKQVRGRPLVDNAVLTDHCARAGMMVLPMTGAHVESGMALTGLHGDPFDRVLVGTARVERITLLTRDRQLLELAPPFLGPLLQEA